jgi:hypothetical protein
MTRFQRTREQLHHRRRIGVVIARVHPDVLPLIVVGRSRPEHIAEETLELRREIVA